MKVLRNLYNWTLEQSSKKYASWFLAFISFIESSFFPIPPDIILITMIISKRSKAFIYASICTLSSVFGGLFGYLIGYALFNSIGIILVNFYGMTDYLQHMKEYYNNYGIWFVLIAGFTPIPFKIITLTSGLFQLNLIIFILCSLIARGCRFYLIAGLLYVFGEAIKKFIDRYFNFLTILFFILLIGGVLVLNYL
tara:strand:- start:624 stop:1208 length:585 start_codon:yes stop_codon:yes gene_type:complete